MIVYEYITNPADTMHLRLQDRQPPHTICGQPITAAWIMGDETVHGQQATCETCKNMARASQTGTVPRTTLDDSMIGHNAFVDTIIEFLHSLDDGEFKDSAFYVQSFVIAKYGEPTTVWRWDANADDVTRPTIAGTWVESTRTDLRHDLRDT